MLECAPRLREKRLKSEIEGGASLLAAKNLLQNRCGSSPCGYFAEVFFHPVGRPFGRVSRDYYLGAYHLADVFVERHHDLLPAPNRGQAELFLPAPGSQTSFEL